LHHAEVEARLHVGSSHRNGHAAGQGRVLQKARLHEIGLGDAEVFVEGLQVLVVEQRDLDRGVDREVASEQRAHASRDRAVVGAASIPEDVPPRARFDESRGVAKRRRGGGRCARGQQGESSQEGAPGCALSHVGPM
jgi:hypothetical protein